MQCIVCGADTRVSNSRPHKTTPSVWRRRNCKSCNTAFTTWETVHDDDYEFMVTNGKHKTSFSLPRLLVSIYACLAHRTAPTVADDAYWLATTVAQQIQLTASNNVTVEALTTATRETLLRFDELAGLSYGARHKSHIKPSAPPNG